LQPRRTLLTHISHHLDLWLMTNELPPGMELAFDNLCVEL
ncbi:MAG: phosphonate metabolism protein PhnP, partial [Pseudomonadota bacterium]